MKDYNREKFALEEVKIVYEKIYEMSDNIDDKSMNLLSSSSLILTLFGILQLSFELERQSISYLLGLGILVFMYVLLVFYILLTISPKNFQVGIKANKETLERLILEQEEKEAY